MAKLKLDEDALGGSKPVSENGRVPTGQAAAAAMIAIEGFRVDCGDVVILGLGLDEEQKGHVTCKLVDKASEAKMKMNPELCLRVGNPTRPGLEIPSDERLKELQSKDSKLAAIMRYLEEGGKDPGISERVRVSDGVMLTEIMS